ncbi:MAG TPA: HTH domain-containing protein [Gemmataceae bacterium]|jgi:hypothetical protein
MAAKKNTNHASLRTTPRGRRPKSAEIENSATDGPAPAEAVLADAGPAPAEPLPPAEAAEAPADPAADSSGGATPTVSAEETTATLAPSPESAAPADKLSALDAAAKVLGDTGQSMSCPELITAMAAKGYWSSPKGRTPAGTLYSAILRELQSKGERARFRKSERGKFTLRENV